MRIICCTYRLHARLDQHKDPGKPHSTESDLASASPARCASARKATLIIIAFVSALHSEVLLARKVAATGELWLKLILQRSGTTGALRLAAQSALLLIE